MATTEVPTWTEDPVPDADAAELAESELTDEELDIIVGGLERVWQYDPVPEALGEG